MLESLGYKMDKKQERKTNVTKKKPVKKGSVWLLVNFETKEERQVTFPNILDDDEWRFSHIKSANMSY